MKWEKNEIIWFYFYFINLYKKLWFIYNNCGNQNYLYIAEKIYYQFNMFIIKYVT